jgi:hypothetical protein
MHLSNAFMAGALTLVASCCLGMKQILGGPNAVNYPSQRPATRAVSFLLSAMLMLRGSNLLLGVVYGDAEQLGATAVSGSGAMALFFGVRLWDTLHMRAPARFYRKFDRAMRALNCPPWFDPLTRARREAVLAVLPWARPTDVLATEEARAAVAELIMAGEVVDATLPGRLH